MGKIYYNGCILTMAEADAAAEAASAPEAVLIEDGRITAVGTLEAVKKAASGPCEMADLHGRCLMPGFIDPHSHMVMNGQMSLCAPLQGCASYGDIIDAMRAHIAADHTGEDGLALGFGYDNNFLAEGGQPDRRVLDQVSETIPIFILHVSAHLACANSAALRLAGITADTPDPQGGLIGRLEGSREPSGYLEEAAMGMVQGAIMGRMKADPAAVLGGMQDSYIRHGVTTAQDGATTAGDLALLQAASAAGILKIDVVAYPLMTADGAALMAANEAMAGRYQGHLKLGGYKLVLDGSPQGRSAWMSEPYLGGDPDYRGYPWLTDEQVSAYVSQAVGEGRQLLAHCNGDAASQQYLDAYERALAAAGARDDLRPVMIHCQTVRSDQLDRMARLGMIASIFVGHVWYWGDVHMRNFGPERGRRISPVRDALDRGVAVSFHQDTPVTPPDMLHSVWCAVDRVSRQGNVIGPEQRVGVYEALRAVTVGGAYQYFEENEKGTIEPGKRADMVVLDRSPLAVDPMEIRDIQVLATIKDGQVIYQR